MVVIHANKFPSAVGVKTASLRIAPPEWGREADLSGWRQTWPCLRGSLQPPTPCHDMKLRHVLPLVALVPFFLAGCKPAAPAPAGGSGKLFGVSFQTLDNPFFDELNSGLKGVIAAQGDQLVTLDAQFNSLKQKTTLPTCCNSSPPQSSSTRSTGKASIDRKSTRLNSSH